VQLGTRCRWLQEAIPFDRRSQPLSAGLGSAANGSDVGLGIRAIHPSTSRIVAAAAAMVAVQSSEGKRAEGDFMGCLPIKEDRSA
jgi:hypothetical protein